jgi:adenylylsulfate kinase-like enzyme
MLNYYYSDSIEKFLIKSPSTIIGEISINSRMGHIPTELFAWSTQVEILKEVLKNHEGHIFFEFSIPRMGKRIDCLLIIENVVFVIEFKVGEKVFLKTNIEQVWDYALDLKNFHKPSHELFLVPILIATESGLIEVDQIFNSHNDNLTSPLKASAKNLKATIDKVLEYRSKGEGIKSQDYVNGIYSPTPTIIEAAISLYNNHNVENITRNDAEAVNLTLTTQYISDTIEYAKQQHKKIICFVTGVPGAGKTLVGLKVATEHLDKEQGNTSVFLSGNKPLVDVLQEALARDKVLQVNKVEKKITKKIARQSIKAFIQIIHHYRDEYLRDQNPPYDHVAIFDEAQRAWNKEQTVKFMQQKKAIQGFDYSEPEFLISCLDRHEDWAVIICLVGGGQEINTGEAGISEWIKAIGNRYPHWQTRVSPHLTASEYNAQTSLNELSKKSEVIYNVNLHLAVSMRSFRAENLSRLVKEKLDMDINAPVTYRALQAQYPIALTRNIDTAKKWLKSKARGSERYGIVVSSQAYRLKPLAIDVRSPINHVNWFLDGKDDIRSSFFMEDVATEFQVQGLELDWVCVAWDGDLRYSTDGWKTYSFVGNKWQNIHKEDRKKYLINAYRVLLTRARQGMIIVVPEGNVEDHTRQPEFYNSTFNYLKSIGFEVI